MLTRIRNASFAGIVVAGMLPSWAHADWLILQSDFEACNSIHAMGNVDTPEQLVQMMRTEGMDIEILEIPEDEWDKTLPVGVDDFHMAVYGGGPVFFVRGAAQCESMRVEMKRRRAEQ